MKYRQNGVVNMKRRQAILISSVLLAALLLSSFPLGAPAAVQPKAAAQTAASENAAPPTQNPVFAQTLAAAAISPTSEKQYRSAAPLFGAKFEGDRVAGTAENVDGVYRIAATRTDGEAWHIKLECNYPTVTGREYYVVYRFHSDVAGRVKFGDLQEYSIEKGDNELIGLVIAKSSTSYLDLQLGALGPFTIDFREIEIVERQDDMRYENALPAPVEFDADDVLIERHDPEYGPMFMRRTDSITINYYPVSHDPAVWKARLYVSTGMIPGPGNRYRVSAELYCDEDMDYELLLNRDEQEKGYGALYGRHLTGGVTQTVEHILSLPENGFADGELVLQFSLGCAPEDVDVTIGNVRVEKVSDNYKNALPGSFALNKQIYNGKTNTTVTATNPVNVALPNFSYSGTDTVHERHDNEYAVTLTESADRAELAITQAPDDRGVWKVQLYAETGVTLEAGTTYRIRYALDSADAQADYEACFDGDYENAYGALYGRSLTAGGTDLVEQIVTPDVSHGPLTLRLQLGKTDSTAGNSFTLHDLSVEKLTPAYSAVGNMSFTAGTAGTVWEEHSDGVAQTVSASGGTATLNITAPRSEGGVWSSKLFVKTGVTPEAGASYRVSATLSATADTGNFEILYQNAASSELYGGNWAPNAPGTWASDFTAGETCGELVLCFQLGNCAAPNTVTVSDLQVRRINGGSDTDVMSADFAYPVTTAAGSTHVDDAWVAQNVNASAEVVAWDESAATATASGNTASLQITQVRNPGMGGAWSTRLEVNTGVTLEQGVQYKVSGNLSSGEPFDSFEVLYSNGSGADEGAHNPGGQGYAEGSWGLNVAEANGSVYFEKVFTVPERSEYRPLVLRIQAGNVPEPTTVTVSNISVTKFVPAHDEDIPGSTDNKSFFLETNNGAAAALSGDGSSATATVTTPGDDWHIKLYANTGAAIEAGQTYRIEVKVSGAGGWAICYKRAGAGENDYDGTVSFGETVTNTVTPTQDGNLEILLKLGAVEAGGAVTIRDIRVVKLGTESLGDNLMTGALTVAAPGNVDFWAHESYTAALSVDGASATLNVTPPADGREFWKVKLFAHTGISLTAGKHYRISADVSADSDTPYEICYNNGDAEKGVGALYGLQATAAGSTAVFEATPESDAALVLQVNLGMATAPTAFTLSNVKVEEMTGADAENALPSFHYDSVGSFSVSGGDGYLLSLDKAASSATFTIHQAPEVRDPWRVKLNVSTGFVPAAGQAYLVSYDVDAAQPQGSFETFLDGDWEAAYGEFFGLGLHSGKNSFSHLVYPNKGSGVLSLQLRFGQTDNTDGNRYTISNVKVQSVKLFHNTYVVDEETSSLRTEYGYSGTLSRMAKQVSARLTATPKTGREAWKTKLFIPTGVELRAGQKYRVSFEVFSNADAPYELCLNRDGVEKDFGAMYGLTATYAPQVVDYIFYAGKDGYLELQFSLGNAVAPCTFNVSNLRVEKAAGTSEVSDTIYTF